MRETVRKILEIESEQKRRYRNNALARYNTERVHEKQMAFHRCAKRNRWVFGGNRTGKTECGLRAAITRTAKTSAPTAGSCRSAAGCSATWRKRKFCAISIPIG